MQTSWLVTVQATGPEQITMAHALCARADLGKDTKQEQPDATGVASSAGGAACEGQHSIVLGKGGVGQGARQGRKEAVDSCSHTALASIGFSKLYMA